ncbi:MAG: hypothetical protein CM15mV2_0670 [uncultured marine virus]|nr:MAG: hypothetical protein CM15mV2_0670 [uncultured marine virus]
MTNEETNCQCCDCSPCEWRSGLLFLWSLISNKADDERTETQSTVQETINSIDYRTGWEYSVTGVGIENGQNPVNPNVTNSTVQVTPGVSARTPME